MKYKFYNHQVKGNIVDWDFETDCPFCSRKLELGDILKVGDRLLCLFCKGDLGSFLELPQKAQEILK